MFGTQGHRQEMNSAQGNFRRGPQPHGDTTFQGSGEPASVSSSEDTDTKKNRDENNIEIGTGRMRSKSPAAAGSRPEVARSGGSLDRGAGTPRQRNTTAYTNDNTSLWKPVSLCLPTYLPLSILSNSC